ncbi:hypothetical protein [Erythrobacter aureus]|uniref:hypothetical protein n=1 Tax=Erythrobacter aureus TaxID=2182384 RepID=UPI0013B43A6C|nr:hypothetical protein [Erythrobacter aureus]
MITHSTAKSIVLVRGETATYAVLNFQPQIDSQANSVEILGFQIRRGDERFTLEDLPISRVLSKSAKDDILYHTFEVDEDERSEYHEVDFEIPEYNESVRVHFRAVENDEYPDILFYEVEDTCGDWLPVENVLFSEMMTESFKRILETSAMEQLDDHNLDLLPMAAE